MTPFIVVIIVIQKSVVENRIKLCSKGGCAQNIKTINTNCYRTIS